MSHPVLCFAKPAHVTLLLAELGASARVVCHGSALTLVSGFAPHTHTPAFALDTWASPHTLTITSTGDAARRLKNLAGAETGEFNARWGYVPIHEHLDARARLVCARLNTVRPGPYALPVAMNLAEQSGPVGGFTMLAENTVLASRRISRVPPGGVFEFVQDRASPPSRAYLKLWEAVSLLAAEGPDAAPKAGDTALDLGAAPGGWTWALASLGVEVTAVDKADVDPRVSAMPRVNALRTSAFQLVPTAAGPVDWVVSDIACYPSRLLQLVESWLAHGGLVRRGMICTIKLQDKQGGEASASSIVDTVRAFQRLPGANVVSLWNNKNEVTLLLRATGPGGLPPTSTNALAAKAIS